MATCCIQLLLQKPYTAVDRMDRMDLIGKGRPTPALPSLAVNFDGKVLQFDANLYTRHDWLCGSELLKAVYCWPCILFAQDRISYWTKLGYRELTGLTKAAASHEDSIGHIRSRYQYTVFVNQNMAIKPKEKVKAVPNPTIAKNHKFLKAAIETVYLLAQSNSLQEEKSRQYVSLSNFVWLLRVHGDYDEATAGFLLREGPEAQAESLQFLSDVVESVAKAIQDAVKAEVKETSFVTLVVDESSDTPNQIYIGLRYLTPDNKLVERLLGFLEVNDSEMAAGILEYLGEAELGDKLVAQAWGATTCSTATLDETQRTIKGMTTANIFLPYDVGEVIFTLSQAVSGVAPLKAFFASLNRITALFNETDKLSARMDRVFQDFSPGGDFAPEGGSCANFLSYMIDLTKNPVYVVKENRLVLVERFKQIMEQDSDDMEAQLLGACAQACIYLQNEMVITYLSVFEKMFVIVHRMINWISEASSDGFSSIRLSEIVRKAIAEIADLSQTEWTQDALTPSIYQDVSRAVSIVTGSLALRLDELERLKFFRLFGTKNYRQYLKTFPDDLMSNLTSLYEKHFNRTRLKNELLVIYGTADFVDKTPPFLFNYFQEDKTLASIFPQTQKLLQLMITLPSHFIPVSNGRLSHRVRDHTRRFVGQPRVSELAVIDANLDLFGDVKATSEFFNAFIDDLANKQRDMELKQLEDQDGSEMEVVVSIRQGLR